MGVMNKMREKTSVILWILVIAFGGIWVFSDSGAAEVIGRENTLHIGVVDGEPIKTEDFQNMMNNLEQRASQSGQTLTSSMRDQMSDNVFNALVEKVLLERECRRLGITVTDAEVQDMVFGPVPDPMIAQAFGDAQGTINRTALNNFWNNAQNRVQVLQIQQGLREQRLQNKLNALLAASANVSLADAKEEYTRRNQKFSAEFIALPLSQIDDKNVKPTDADLQAYYNEHKDEFKRKKGYVFDFVSMASTATASDSARIKTELSGLIPAFQAATNNAAFLSQNGSATPLDTNYVSRAMLESQPQLANAIFNAPAVGKIVGPVGSGKEMHLVKITGVRAAKAGGMSRASHILVDDQAKANDLLSQLKNGGNFEMLARENSKDGSAQQGGDLGWSLSSKYVAEFKAAIDSAPVGQVVGPVKTQFGYHLIKVVARDNQEIQIADLTRSVEVGAGGVDKMRKRMEDFSYYATENGNFKAEAGKYKMQVQNTTAEEGTNAIPLIGTSRAILNFLANANTGQISDVIELDDKMVVVQLTQVLAEGHKSMSEVRTLIEPKVRAEKKKQMLVTKFQNALRKNGFGQGLASALGVTMQNVADQSFGSGSIANLGVEPKFLGTAMSLKNGQTSGVILGENAVYMMKMINKTGGDPNSVPQAELDRLRGELRQQIGNQLRQQWMANLRKKADVEDLRKNFGR